MVATPIDPDPVLSTTEVGRLFDVHPSTVKRWCDRGRLSFSRTRGGHRRIPLSEALLRARQEGIAMPLHTFGEDAGAVWEVTLAAADRGDFGPARTLAEGWLEAREFEAIGDLIVHLGRQPDVDLSRLFDEGVRDFMREVGCRWEEGRLSVGEEHLLSETMTEALHCLRHRVSRERAMGDGSPVAVIGCADGERHDLGARCVQIALEGNGWKVRFLGADVPMEEWTALQQETGAALVGVSFSPLRAPADVLRCVRRLSEDYDPDRPHLLALGGGAAVDSTLASPGPFRDLRYFTGTGDLLRWLAVAGSVAT